MANPINRNNAIESSCFALVFQRPFNKHELQSLTRLEKELQGELPCYQPINSIRVQMLGDGKTEQTLEVSGALLQRFQPNGKPSWEIKVEHNTIEVSCFSYDEWSNVWQKVKMYLLETIKGVENDNNKVILCVLKIINKFSEDLSSYDVKNVFSITTPYLTKNVFDKTNCKLWHVFQGWFEEANENRAYLTNLNLITSEENGVIVTTIDHMIQRQFSKNPQVTSDLRGMLDEIFSDLHDKNKILLQSLLSDPCIQKIGL